MGRNEVDDMYTSRVGRLATVNLSPALFNLIPAFALDGGRALRSALESQMGFVRATERAALVGQFTAFVLGNSGLFRNRILVFVAAFVYVAEP
jgi:stage IV sporulation protein FB